MSDDVHVRIRPRRTLAVYGGLLAGSLVMIWAVCLASLHFVRANDRAGLESRIAADVLILQEVAARALDAAPVPQQALDAIQALWTRVDEDEVTELALFDLQARRLVTHHPVLDDDQWMAPALRTAVQSAPIGTFAIGPDDRYRVTYRVIPRHAVVMVVTGDRVRLDDTRIDQVRLFIGAAALATLAVIVLLGLFYRGQRRYEASAVALSNQARAIDAHVIVSEAAPDGRIIRVNEAFERAMGYEANEVIGQNHRLFNSGVHPPAYYERLWSTVLAGRIWTGVFRNRRKDGRLVWMNATIIPYLDAWGRVERFVALYNDVTESVALTREVKEERRQREALARINRSLLTAAHTDPLTGLANRRGFDSFVEQALAAAVDHPRPMAVMMLDLDHFKRVNDTHGHAAGDAVLKEMARRWSRQIRDSDLLARLGGEEFCVVLPGTPLEDALAVAEKLRRVTANDPVALVSDAGEPLSLPVTVSVGVSGVESTRDLQFDTLLHSADEAVYEAKHGGRNRVGSRTLRSG